MQKIAIHLEDAHAQQDLRVTSITSDAIAGAITDRVEGMAGHSSMSTTERYVELRRRRVPIGGNGAGRSTARTPTNLLPDSPNLTAPSVADPLETGLWRPQQRVRGEVELLDRFRSVEGRERGELLRVVRDADGVVEKLYFATDPVRREPSAF